jgi:5-methylcytosine-specific restriction endonuclease McrA
MDIFVEDRLARLCKRYQAGDFMQDKHFVMSALRAVAAWDNSAAYQFLRQVEATLGTHFCDLWSECQEGNCIYAQSPSEWIKETKDWAILKEMNHRNKQVRSKVLGASMRYDILKRDGYRCQICGKGAEDGARLEIDHLIARSKGGDDSWENLWTLCFECNRGKGTKGV